VILPQDEPFHKVGKLWKFKISEVDAWVISGQAKKIIKQH